MATPQALPRPPGAVKDRADRTATRKGAGRRQACGLPTTNVGQRHALPSRAGPRPASSAWYPKSRAGDQEKICRDHRRRPSRLLRLCPRFARLRLNGENACSHRKKHPLSRRVSHRRNDRRRRPHPEPSSHAIEVEVSVPVFGVLHEIDEAELPVSVPTKTKR
jgi:hypothetical protein